MSINKLEWIPEIMYEEFDNGLSSNIPFISVPNDKSMPPILFIFESRETGEYEPGPEGEELPVTSLDLHQYADMNVLKTKLTWEQYDTVRAALGLEPLNSAIDKGKKISENIRNSVGD